MESPYRMSRRSILLSFMHPALWLSTTACASTHARRCKWNLNTQVPLETQAVGCGAAT